LAAATEVGIPLTRNILYAQSGDANNPVFTWDEWDVGGGDDALVSDVYVTGSGLLFWSFWDQAEGNIYFNFALWDESEYEEIGVKPGFTAPLTLFSEGDEEDYSLCFGGSLCFGARVTRAAAAQPS
jgi:hypothetical protein